MYYIGGGGEIHSGDKIRRNILMNIIRSLYYNKYPLMVYRNLVPIKVHVLLSDFILFIINTISDRLNLRFKNRANPREVNCFLASVLTSIVFTVGPFKHLFPNPFIDAAKIPRDKFPVAKWMGLACLM